MLTELIQAVSNPSPIEWLSTHVQLVGWPVLCLFAWKASALVTEIKHTITKTFGQIDTMATNHFPHMEASLTRQDTILANQTTVLKSMDDSMKTLVENTTIR